MKILLGIRGDNNNLYVAQIKKTDNKYRLNANQQITKDTFTPSFEGKAYDVTRCLDIINNKFLEKIDSMPYNEIARKTDEYICKTRDNCMRYIKANVHDNPNEGNVSKSFIGDFSHQFAGSFIDDYRTRILNLEDQNISAQEKNNLSRGYAKAIVQYLDETCNLYKFFVDNNLDSTTKTIGLDNVFSLVKKSFQEQLQDKNIALKLTNNELFEKYSQHVTSDYKNYIIMSNLLSNAIKYSPDNSTVKIGLKVKDNELKFFVQDQGIGINLSERKQILNGKRGSNVGDISGTGYGLQRIVAILDRKPERIKIISPASTYKGELCGTYIEVPLIMKENAILAETEAIKTLAS